MGWESSNVVRFDFGPLLQGQMRIGKLKSAHNSLIIISPDESRGYICFTSVASPHVLTCVRDNSKTLSQISFKLGTHMYLGQERNPILR